MALQNDNRVLVVDDSAIYRHLITGHLKGWGFDITLANSGLEAWKILQRPGGPTLVLLDWVMPGMDGVELCRKIREAGSADAYVYIILLTAKDSRSDLLKALEAGADDYLAKPFDEQELKARLLVGKRILGLQQELVRARESMRFASSHDGLTGLMNRTEIVKALNLELDRSHREKKPLTVLMADIDHFKMVNDQLGHLAGDEVLKEVAKRLRSQLRTYDSVGRYGGEEFLVLMPGCDVVAALVRADQIRSALSSSAIGSSAKARTITLSMGVAVTDGNMRLDAHDLLHQADCGLYKAKQVHASATRPLIGND
ncbi:MAG: diguanylate cyclase [Acidobacteriia bacterium]|nr:diguanylate cyclase [Terriglobia bacterium]